MLGYENSSVQSIKNSTIYSFLIKFAIQMKKYILFLTFICFFTHKFFAQTPVYQAMMQDFNINFYTVCDSAEAYFKNKDKGKGSGYKPFLRWKYENESKYFPSGNRILDHYLPAKEFDRIKESEVIKKEEIDKNIEIGVSELSLFPTGTGWQSLGPDSISNITIHYASGLGRVEYVDINKNNAQQIYIGSRSGGLWRTSNGGSTWIHHTDFLPASGVNAIAASPSNFDSVLINVRIAENGTSFGIYRSVDGGVNFTKTPFNPTNLGFGGLGNNFQINIIKYHPKIKNLVFVGTDRGIFKSTDNLVTWTRLNTSWNVRDIEFHPTKDSIIYIYENYYWGTNKNNIFKSTNLGVSYSALSAISGNSDASINISLSAVCANCIFLSSNNGIWKSTNGGTTFTTTVSPAPTGVSLYYATPNDNDTSKYVSGYVDLFRSTNGGSSFNQCTWWSLGSAQNGNGNFQQNFKNSTNYVHADCNYLTCVNGTYYGCTDGFLVKSTDNGVTWKKLSTKVGIRENYNLGLSQSNHYKSISGSQDNGTSIKIENGWIEAYGADGMECLIHPLNENWMIGSTQYGGRIRTLDNGTSINGIAPSGQSAWWIAPMFYDPNNHMTIYSIGVNVHKSTNFGTTWRTLGAPSSFSGNQANYGTIAENNSSLIVLTNGEKIELSKDSGNTFTSIKNTLPNQWITDVIFAPKNDSIIIVTYGDYQNNSQKVYISKNLGNTWTNITYNLGNMPIHSTVIDHSDSANIYLGAAIGIYKKSMIGKTWKLYNKDLPNVSIKELEINNGSNTIKAATWGRGIWEYALVDRENYPSIVKTNITSEITANSPKSSVKQTVTSNIESKDSLTSVFVKWSYNTPKFNNYIAMSKTSGITWTSKKPLPDSIAGTKIFFKVFAVGKNKDTSETYKFMYTLYPFEYCAAKGEKVNGNLFINRLRVANIDNNNTGNTLDTTYANKKVILYIDSTYTITGDINTGWTENDFHTWIDYNRDASFSVTEKVAADINTGSLGTGTLKVPTTALEGNTLMRVRLGYWDNTYSPCGTTLGEVENYPVEIRKVPLLSYSGDTAICESTKSMVKYNGTLVDSVKWSLSNGVKIFSYKGDSFSTVSLPAAKYSITVRAYKYGILYTKPYANAFRIIAKPTVSAGADTRICINKSVILTGISTDTLSWNYGISNGISFNPIITKLYVLTAKNARNCKNTDTVKVTVDSLPYVNAGINQRICKGNSATLSGNGAGTLTWNNNVINGATFTPSVSNSYVITATNTLGCIKTDTTMISLDTLPKAFAGINQRNCFKIKVVLNGSGDGTYAWNNNVINGVAFAPKTTQSYILTVTNPNNCIGLDTVLITVDTLPLVNAGVDKNICNKDFVTLNGRGDGQLTWDNGIQNNISFKPNNSSSYVLTSKNVNNCLKKDTANITVNKPDTGITKLNNTTLQANAISAQYQWINCNNFQVIPTATNREYTATANGNYAVVVTQNNCTDTSKCINLLPLSVTQIIQSDMLKIYPNPTNGIITVEYKSNKLFSYILTDLNGKIVLKSSSNILNRANIVLDIFESGIYIISIKDADRLSKNVMINLVK